MAMKNIPGTSRSKFHHLLNIVWMVVCIIHSNTEKHSAFSRTKKNLTHSMRL